MTSLPFRPISDIVHEADQMTTRRTYTAEVAPEFADQFAEWRPITDVADEIKVVTHDDGTCEFWFRVAPKIVALSPNGDGQH